MKSPRLSALAFLLALLTVAPLRAETPAAAKPETVQTTDGRKFFGIVTIKDDYTILISTDSGLTNLPIASLQGDSWKKYSKDPDRKGDGKFWSQRQDSLTSAWKIGGQTTPLDSVLTEVAPHLSEIVSFQETQPAAAPSASPGTSPGQSLASDPSTNAPSTIEIKLFSGPGGLGSGGMPSVPSIPGTGALPTMPSMP